MISFTINSIAEIGLQAKLDRKINLLVSLNEQHDLYFSRNVNLNNIQLPTQDVVSQRKEKIPLLDILIQVLYVMDTSLSNATD